MSGIVYGYVRVSTKEQNETRQVIAMHEFGIEEKNIIIEKQSGKDFERPRYKDFLGGSRQETPLSSKASTGLAEIMTRSSTSGGGSQR